MRIDNELIKKIAAQAEAEYPEECCGYLAGADGKILGVYPMENIDHSSEHFTFSPEEQFRVLKQARADGFDILGPYHSHPETPARMSAEDLRLANDYKAIYAIYSVAEKDFNVYSVTEDSSNQRIAVKQSLELRN